MNMRIYTATRIAMNMMPLQQSIELSGALVRAGIVGVGCINAAGRIAPQVDVFPTAGLVTGTLGHSQASSQEPT
jgi:hypothetical protein